MKLKDLLVRTEHALWKAIPELDRLHDLKVQGRMCGQLITGHPHSQVLEDLALEIRAAINERES